MKVNFRSSIRNCCQGNSGEALGLEGSLGLDGNRGLDEFLGLLLPERRSAVVSSFSSLTIRPDESVAGRCTFGMTISTLATLFDSLTFAGDPLTLKRDINSLMGIFAYIKK